MTGPGELRGDVGHVDGVGDDVARQVRGVVVDDAGHQPVGQVPFLRDDPAEFPVVHVEQVHFGPQARETAALARLGERAEDIGVEELRHHELADVVQQRRGIGLGRERDATVGWQGLRGKG